MEDHYPVPPLYFQQDQYYYDNNPMMFYNNEVKEPLKISKNCMSIEIKEKKMRDCATNTEFDSL
jgi:hypothetical protein